MESEGLVSEASWNSFDVAMSAKESDMIAHLLGGHQFLNELDQDRRIEMPPIFWPDHGADLYHCLDEMNHNSYCFSPVTSSTSTSSFSLPLANNGGYYSSDSNAVLEISTSPTTKDFSTGKEQIIAQSLPAVSCHQFNEPICVTMKISSDEFRVSKEKTLVPALPSHQNSQAIKKRIHVSDAEQPTTNEKDGISIGSPKKKARASAPEMNGGGGASSRSAPSPSEKTSQSLYERKRRERINKRLRILQYLVPNGTKADISTMLEEAVQYVKFLQLQIKLLSSHELWMYAPTAYNGINIGL
uniref:Transcription factor bHLH85-like n=1 Tax=Elaeis guineensis var. tenera TaxID=51953 RepID=A0A8N4ERS1_ELAGV|nr:transcription factor bHLH85-like [Elaeis guineensis]